MALTVDPVEELRVDFSILRNTVALPCLYMVYVCGRQPQVPYGDTGFYTNNSRLEEARLLWRVLFILCEEYKLWVQVIHIS